MAISWSVQIYTGSIVCPTCVNNQFQIGEFNGSTYKRCIECGRVSKVEDADNLTANE